MVLKGKLFKEKDSGVWMIRYVDSNVNLMVRELPVYRENLTESQKWSMDVGMEIEFEIIDEFTHPKLYENVGLFDGITMAKLIFR